MEDCGLVSRRVKSGVPGSGTEKSGNYMNGANRSEQWGKGKGRDGGRLLPSEGESCCLLSSQKRCLRVTVMSKF